MQFRSFLVCLFIFIYIICKILIKASCRRVVSHVKHSIKAMTELRAAQLEENLPQHQLLQAMAVRWNSTLIMLERLLE